MKKQTIQKLAQKYDVRLSEAKEGGKRVLGLHGFKADIEAVVRQVSGYWVQWADTGAYLYSEKAGWN